MKFIKNKLSIFFATIILFGAFFGLLSPETVNSMYTSWIKDTSVSKEFESLIFKDIYVKHDNDESNVQFTSTNSEEVAAFIRKYNTLPINFITKEEAFNEGWKIGDDLWAVAKEKSLGGSIFKNFEGKLPIKEGRLYRECDLNYTGGARGKERLVYSNDGLIFITSDHYQSFIEL